jgi:hypothetical protein
VLPTAGAMTGGDDTLVTMVPTITGNTYVIISLP